MKVNRIQYEGGKAAACVLQRGGEKIYNLQNERTYKLIVALWT